MTYRHILFIVSLLCCPLLAWIGGFNFDERSPEVAIGVVFSILIAISIVTYPDEKLDTKVRK